jgi:glyoxylase-like metal-dependent hydrolase (beta-lactamase superfamily II)
VIFTHWHWDHHNAATQEINGVNKPSFPNAHHYLHREDWDLEDCQTAIINRESAESKSLAVLHKQGLLNLLDGDTDLGSSVSIIHTPSESPGHQIVKVDSENEVFYFLGDLYHHAIEVKYPDWVTLWSDPIAAFTERKRTATSAFRENAVLFATHIKGFGKLESTGDGFEWHSLKDT